jgi:hypothetical protein
VEKFKNESVNQDFKGRALLRVAYYLVLLGMPVLSVVFRNAPDAGYLHGLTAGALLCVFLAWPRTIHLTEEGIWQRNRIGRRQFISWDSVDSLAYMPLESKILVGGGNVEIFHTMFHSDPELFAKTIDLRKDSRFFGSGMAETSASD